MHGRPVVLPGLRGAVLQTDSCNASCSPSVLTLNGKDILVKVGWVCVDKAGLSCKIGLFPGRGE